MVLTGFTALFYAQTPIPAGASYDLGFSPGGTALSVVKKSIKSARKDILVACYEFTNRDIADAIETAARNGVKVQIVADWKAAHNKYSQIKVLSAAGIPIRLDRNYAIHHNKFMVIDGASVETGSFNYTDGAVKHNAENAIVLWNVPPVARAYSSEWHRLWNESQPGK